MLPSWCVYALKESNLLPILIEAIKEQQAQIDKLNRELATIKATKVVVHPANVDAQNKGKH
jgi:hypothetical protein